MVDWEKAAIRVGMEVNRKLHVMQRIAQYAPGIIRSAALVYGNGRVHSDEAARIWTGKMTAAVLAGLVFFLLAGLLAQDAALAESGALLALLVPIAMWRDLERRLKARHRMMVTELPVFIHKMSLLIGAGDTVQGSWVRASIPALHHCEHPLYRELERMRVELAQSVPFPKALELFAQRCGIPEVNYVVTATLMNYRRGGDAFALILQQTGRSMIEKKRTVLKTMGEEATAKMVFPMVLIFAAMLAVVAAPAIMLMKQGY